MYGMFDVIYGVPLTENIWTNEYVDQGDIDIHFEIVYNGNSTGYGTGYCGVKLDDFDDTSGPLPLTNLKLKPANNEMSKAQRLVNDLPDEIKKIASPIGVYIIFGTS